VNFLDRFLKNNKIRRFIKIRSVEVELFHADRQTDRQGEADSRSSQFCERTYMGPVILITIITHHTRRVTSYIEAPWINMGSYCRTLIVIPKFNGSTEMKASFVAEQDDGGIYFSITHPLQVQFYNWRQPTGLFNPV
jgi:hypothetical protein